MFNGGAMKKIKFCSHCGQRLVRTDTPSGFNEQTGKPKYWEWRCPAFKIYAKFGITNKCTRIQYGPEVV